jgi:hypothetical protein
MDLQALLIARYGLPDHFVTLDANRVMWVKGGQRLLAARDVLGNVRVMARLGR